MGVHPFSAVFFKRSPICYSRIYIFTLTGKISCIMADVCWPKNKTLWNKNVKCNPKSVMLLQPVMSACPSVLIGNKY